MTPRRALLAAALAAPLAACARQAPLYTATEIPFGGDAPERERSRQVRQAGAGLGWAMEDVGPGQIRGTLALRTHQAVVDIRYDRRRFSIYHASSQDLGFDGATIHNNYNGWVRRLQQTITAQSAA